MSYRLQVLLPDDLAARIRTAAERSRVSGGEWVRRAVLRALAEERAASDPLAALSALDAPTADLEQMLAEIEAGRR
ncbi:MAG TPA: CopG family transcriptional regulator [Longimicrobiaceae bacterium]|nr:CopG family transcriptional regulator [Longimicrobiaceae bacterium]